MKALGFIFALLCTLLPLAAQDKPAPGPACDLAKIEDADWCPKCKKAVAKEGLEGEKCKVCMTPVEKLKVCVKMWIPRCGMHEQHPHLENCCKSKKCCVMTADKSPIVFKCMGCGQTARDEGKIAHDAKDHEKKVVKTCEASGTAPHGGEPIK